MSPPIPKLAWALVATTFVAALAVLPARLRPAVREVTVKPERPGVLPAVCPPGSLPDESVCIPAPPPAGSAAPLASGVALIALRADRSVEYRRYPLPVRAETVRRAKDDPAFVRDGGAPLSGVALRAVEGWPVIVHALDKQQGAASVLFSGTVVGTTLVTYHVVRRGDVREEYIVLIGNLVANDLPAPRAALEDGARVGKVSKAPLYLDVRLLRPGVDPWTLTPANVTSETTSVSTDVRNVYPILPDVN